MHCENPDLLIAYSLLPFLTPNRTRLLREHFEPISAAREATEGFLQALLSLPPEQAAIVKNPLNIETRSRIALLRESMVTLDDPRYPPLLREIIDPPLALHVRGDLSLAERPSVSVVGSRRATPYGLNVAKRLTQELVSAGVVIVSGLARGIDAAAHEAALDCGGTTIAVLGTGIDVVYPRSHTRLFRRIESEGLILSEFPPETAPLPENFPIRNRVISGLSSGTLIVEATTQSGSLITARMAAEQGREVFAVPGSIFSDRSEGTHRLIQYGAKLVHDGDDVLDELPGHLKIRRDKSPAEPESPLREVLHVLSREEAMHVDLLAEKLRLGPQAVAASLLQLELDGWIKALPGARYVRVR